ncbi:glycosyltransferase [Butyrivibrio sp. VCB2006]|uniref:glycosyltransferase n=1 Tax=Butyrivibrio sp. VCB2006 TaxID=1280679 RepID=UPI0003F6B7EF|nr:glycosyltransferase [Butyrivibrio sp. VCB2006]
MFDKLSELISHGELQDALYEFQDEYFHIDERTPSEAAKLCVLEASIWEGLNDGTAELSALYKGLGYDFSNYEIYYMLGLYYRNINVNQAYLCMEMALNYCTSDEDRQVIESSFDVIKASPGLRVRNTSIMILSYNDLDILKMCIQSVKKYAPSGSYEIVVVDNASPQEGVAEYLKELENPESEDESCYKLILSEENLGFPAGCNLGAANCNPENDIFFLNNDAVLMPLSLFWLKMGLYDNRSVGATGAFSNSASLQELSGDIFAEFIPDGVITDGDYNLWHKKMEPSDAVKVFEDYAGAVVPTYVNPYIKTFRLTGFAVLVSREAICAIQESGSDEPGSRLRIFDEIFSPGYFEDDDLGIRLACAGYEQYICKNSLIYHNGGGGFEGHADAMERGRERFEDKWGFDIWSYSLPWDSACDEVVRLSKEKKGILKVLDFSCGLGANASYIKSKTSNARIYGVCANSFAAGIASNIADEVAFGDANTSRLPWEDHSFDVVIAEKSFVSKGQIGRYLKPGGVSICEDAFPF